MKEKYKEGCSIDIKTNTPISNKKEDLLNYDIYVDTLFEMISKSNKNLKIGVFGNYGSGKSTIIELLKTKLKPYEKTEMYRIIHISTWGYNPIQIVRKLFIELDNKLKLNKNYKKELFQSKEIFPKIKLSLLILIYLLICTAILIILPKIFINNKFDDLLIQIITTSIIILSGITSYLSISKSKPKQIDEFEIEWEDISKYKRLKNKKIILIIDDLDRCDGNTINTTLSKLNVIIEKSKHLNVKTIVPLSFTELTQNKINDITYETSKKFFDTHLWVPNTGELDMYYLNKGK